MSKNVPITVARGDGIGPEIMDATLRIIEAAGARIDIEEIEVGASSRARGNRCAAQRYFSRLPLPRPRAGAIRA